MAKKLLIDGQVYEGVTAIKATDADTNQIVVFPDTSDATASASDINAGKSAYVNGEKVNGTNTGTQPNDLDGIIDGTITAFVMPTGKKKISQYRFYQMPSLLTANLGGVETIEANAFDGCNKLTNLVLPATLKNIGAYAFRSVSSSSGSQFNVIPELVCVIGNYAFYGSKVKKVGGKLGAVGDYAFSSCSALTEVDISESGNIGNYAFQNETAITKLHAKITGSVGSYAFYGCYNLSDLDLSESKITSLGNYAFSRICGNRSNPSQNVIVLDLRKSTFSTIPTYCFGSDTSSNSYRPRYMKFRFPNTVGRIESYAFRYSDTCEFYFSSPTPPTLATSNAWDNSTNHLIFVPFGSINAYRNGTNWTAQASKLRGYVEAGTYEVGATLPELNAEGYELTWYSDKDLTTQVTTVTDANAEYYCTAGTEKVAYGITGVTAIDCTITITDNNGKSYAAGEGVRTGTVLTIVGTPTTPGNVPYLFKVNGADFTSGGTITVDSDISITAIYWDGANLPVNPVFSENSWTIIAETFKAGNASQFWKVGDTKSITSKSGKQYTIRIADMQPGRYAYADGSGDSNGVLEFVELVNLNGVTAFKMNNTQKNGAWNGGGFALSDMRNTYLPNILADLPDDMQAAIGEVNVLSGTGSGSTSGTSSSANKLFLPAEMEMFDARHYSIGNTECPLGQFDYYKQHNTNAERIKRTVGTTNASYYWLRSPYSGGSYNFVMVYYGGDYYLSDASDTRGVAPCFAI